MKNLVLVIAFFTATAQAKTTRILLEYEFGNQITRSGLLVLSNGVVLKNETLMGTTTYLPDSLLTPTKVQFLIKLIDKASIASQVRNDKIEAAEGGSYGQAKINTSEGSSAILYTIVEGDRFKKTVVCQSGRESDQIREFIQKNVRDQMPLQLAPCK